MLSYAYSADTGAGRGLNFLGAAIIFDIIEFICLKICVLVALTKICSEYSLQIIRINNAYTRHISLF